MSFIIPLVFGFLVALPLGPVGASLLKISNDVFKRAVLMLFALDVVLSICFVAVGAALNEILSHPVVKVLSAAFLMVFATMGLVNLKRVPKEVKKISNKHALSKVLFLAVTNPGTYLMFAASYMFLELSQYSHNDQFVRLVLMSLGTILWYVVARKYYVKKTVAQKARIEKIVLITIGVLGAFGFFRAISRTAMAGQLSNSSEIICDSSGVSIGSSTRKDCKVNFSNGQFKKIHMLYLKGEGSRIAFDHGYLMGREAEAGVMLQVHSAIDMALRQGPLLTQPLKAKVFSCMLSRVQSSVGQDFLNDVHSFYDGYEASFKQKNLRPKFRRNDVMRAALAIELSIIMEGLAKRLETNTGEALGELASQCGLHVPVSMVSGLAEMLNPFKSGFLKLGCIGGVLPEQSSSLGSLIHIRNLDANLVESWNSAPVVAMIYRKGHIPYVASATAGLIYLGGISGYNQHGVSASLHEMSTTRYQSHHRNQKAIIAPFMMQKIFEQAKSVNHAIELIGQHKHFGSWSFLISDAKSGDSASVEVSGYRVTVARKSSKKVMPQSNHFLAESMRNEFYTYSFNKFLESWGRYHFIDKKLNSFAPGSATIEDMVDVLSSHEDIWEGRRSFGRTATKAITVMSTIAAPGASQFWFTAGERFPASHSNFVGFFVDFDRFKMNPIRTIRTTQYSKSSGWEKSLEKYVDARLAYIQGDKWRSVSLVKEAKALAQKSGIREPVYLYVLGRLYHELKRYDLSTLELNQLVTKTGELHEYGTAMLGLVQMANLVDSGYPQNKIFQGYVDNTGKRLWTLYKKHKHPDLKAKIDLFDQLKNGKKVKLPPIDFVTVE